MITLIKNGLEKFRDQFTKGCVCREIGYDVKGTISTAIGAGEYVDKKVVNTISKWAGIAMDVRGNGIWL